jgi:ankyrin repeat protein
VTGETALTAACGAGGAGSAAAADALLVRGATPYALNARRLSPLALAAKHGRAALVLRLLDCGADVSGADGKNPLVLAAAEGHNDVIEILLEHSKSYQLFYQKDISFSTHTSTSRRSSRDVYDLLL